MVATKYGIISKGKILKEISAEDLKKECQKITVIETKDKERLYELLKEEFAEDALALAPNGVKIYGNILLNELWSKIIAAGIEISATNTTETNIEDYYLSLIGGNHA